MKAERVVFVSVQCPGAPTAAACRRFSTRSLVVLALQRVAIEPPKLARALGVTPEVLERARSVPDVLPLNARLTLAALVGVETALVPLARTLRARTLRALHHPAAARSTPARPPSTGTE